MKKYLNCKDFRTKDTCANIWLISSLYIGLHLNKHTGGLIIIIFEFPFQVSKILKQQSVSKQVQWEHISSMWVERLIDMTKQILGSRNFANDPNISHKPLIICILCSCNIFVCAAESSCFVTVN